MDYSCNPPNNQVEEITPVEGCHLPQEANQSNPNEGQNNQHSTTCNDITQKIVRILEKGHKKGLSIILHDDVDSKKPNWLGMKPSSYKIDLETLINEYLKNPGYGYGIITGKQPNGLYLLAIDVDIDNQDCKEKVAKELETRLPKHRIPYYKETTKSKRLHYYIFVNNMSEEIEKISELPFPYPCFKFKNGAKLPGKIELFSKNNRYIIVYNGRENDEESVLSTDDIHYATLQDVVSFVREWFEVFSVDEEESNQTEAPTITTTTVSKTPSQHPTDFIALFPKLVYAYKIIREHNIINGWEIEKAFSACCVRENISDEKIIEGFKVIYGSEYDEKRTRYILNATRRKDLDLLPTLYQVFHHVVKALQSNISLSISEKDTLEDLLTDLNSRGYHTYVTPEYLKNAENVILYESTEKISKDNKVYYEESYFIELYDDEVKEVIYVTIITHEYKGIYKPHKLVSKKLAGIKTDIIRGVKEYKFEDYEYLINDKIVYRPTFTYTKIDDLVYDLSVISMKYNKFIDMNLYKRYIDKKTKMYVKENHDPKPCEISHTTGWNSDFTGFWHPNLNSQYFELHPDHVLYRKGKNKVFNTDEQHKVVKALLEEGKLLGVLLTISVSSLLIKPLHVPGFTTIISGTSGAGKTTAALVATSLFYYSDDHLIDAQMTRTALELMIASLNSIPTLIDESALAGINFRLEDLIFMVHSGKGKGRGRKDLSVDFKDLKSNIFWTTEVSDIDDLKRSGAFRRSIYLVAKGWEDFTSLYKREDHINTKFSGCGLDYIDYFIKHKEDIYKTFEEQTKRLYSKYTDIITIVLNIWGGLVLLEDFYNTKFYALRKTLTKIFNETKARFVDSRDNITFQVMDYLESVTFQRFHVINKKRDTDELDIQQARQETWGEYDKLEGKYYVTGTGIREIANRLGKNREIMLDELEKAGALIARNKSHYFKSTQGRGKVYILKFRDLNLDELLPPETETSTTEPETEPTPPTEPEPIPTTETEQIETETEQIEPPPEIEQPPETSIIEIDDAIVDAFSRTTYQEKTDNTQTNTNTQSDENDNPIDEKTPKIQACKGI